ncbi:MAG: PKD domain-containing protein [Bacteroidales bacterium]|nr:PKD domain-containing protein [Bacteroidales bacterium]
MKYTKLLTLIVAFFALSTLLAQSRDIDEIFGDRGEIYFEFDKQGYDLNKISRLVSMDLVDGNTVKAYANKKEFQAFLQVVNEFQLLPKPGELLKNPEMLHDINSKEINEWDFYPTYDAYLDMMYQFATDHPDICEVFSIGQTVEGRELMFAKISDNVGTRESEPQFLYTGTMHGDETAGFVLFLRLIDYLLTNYGTNPEITDIVNNMEIWINPAANPDGTYAGGNNTVNGATRYNANNVDLNRNYPDPEDGPHPDGNAWQPETLAFMQMAEENNFVMSANTHGGAEVLNYPWDTWPTLAADNEWWIYVCREYVDTVHLYSPSNYLTDLNNGITNGYAWYTTSGCRQDYMNYFQQCREVTAELSGTKLLPANQLPSHWDWNYRSFINFIQQASYGIKGIVTDQETGDPLEAMVFIEGHDIDSSMVFADPVNGFYQRMLDEGIYNLTFSAPGRYPVTIENITVTKYNAITVDVSLDAGSLIPEFSTTSTTVSLGAPVSFNDLSYGNPLSWEWEFEGATPSGSTVQNPAGIVWNETGTFDVSLTITDGDGNSETVLKEDYISVNAEFLMGNQTITTCTGIFYDTGGESGQYSNDEDFTMTFLPGEAGASIIVDFEMFNIEDNSSCSYDWLKIYNGSTASSPLIGTYCGTDSPGTIEADNADGALTFEFHSDYSVTLSGWKALVSCTTPPLLPVADFTADTTHISQGESVHFSDLTANNPISWAWVFEGGTPSGSSEQNPVIVYNEPGIFDVTLIVQNEFGSDSKTIEEFIIVDSTIGIIENDDHEISVFPNPLVGDLLLNIAAKGIVEEYQIMDYTGKIVARQLVNAGNLKIDLTHKRAGLYFIKLKTGDNWYMEKINIVR